MDPRFRGDDERVGGDDERAAGMTIEMTEMKNQPALKARLRFARRASLHHGRIRRTCCAHLGRDATQVGEYSPDLYRGR
jgi:hypothetical protein